MNKDGLITDQEFNAYLKTWANRVGIAAKMNLVRHTRGTGNLAANLRDHVDMMRDKVGRRVAFRFPQYGVFRAYGAGRGWVIINGVPVKGKRVMSYKEIRERKLNDTARSLLRNGFSMAEVRQAKLADESISNPRRALNWIDGEIERRKAELMDESAGFFGDKCLARLVGEFDKMKIVKKKL